MKKLSILLLPLLLAGCAGINQPSSNSIADLPGVPVSKARAVAVQYLSTNGWVAVRSDDLMVQFEAPGDVGMQLLYASDGRVYFTFTASFVALPSGSQIIGHGALRYTYAYSNREVTTDRTNLKARRTVESIRCAALGEPQPIYAHAPVEPARSPKASQ